MKETILESPHNEDPLPHSCQVGREVLVGARAPHLQEQTRKEKQEAFVKETPSEILF